MVCSREVAQVPAEVRAMRNRRTGAEPRHRFKDPVQKFIGMFGIPVAEPSGPARTARRRPRQSARAEQMRAQQGAVVDPSTDDQ